jgi:hypothetical protein
MARAAVALLHRAEDGSRTDVTPFAPGNVAGRRAPYAVHDMNGKANFDTAALVFVKVRRPSLIAYL